MPGAFPRAFFFETVRSQKFPLVGMFADPDGNVVGVFKG